MPQSMKPGETLELKYWPNSKPLPEGWEDAASFEGCHHGHYGKMIRKKPEMKPGRSVSNAYQVER